MTPRAANTFVTLALAVAAVGGVASRTHAQDARGQDARQDPRPGARDEARAPDPSRTIEGGRENPFLPQSTTGESKLLADRAALQQMVRDMMPELRNSMERNYARDRQEALDELRRAAAANQNVRGGSNSPRIGPTMKLISCINGRALYRDQTSNSTVFAKPGSDQQAPCDPP